MAVSARLQRRTVLLLAAASLACAPAGREGESISITGESAIIVWDEATKTQHFIRRADFRTKAKDFGFLVPTPTVPRLDESDNEAFGFLARLTAPEKVWRLDTGDDLPKPAAMAVAKGEAVKLIEAKKVAGYDAAVLEANDANALGTWLKQHGYHSSPELVEWFKPYIAQRWKITAFKIDKDAGSDRAKASAVRMSFVSEKPFFPYREPKSAANEVEYFRTLRVFFLGTARFEGKIGASSAWPGQTVWSGPLEQKDQAELFKQLKLSGAIAGAKLRLTEFIDDSSPRPGSDDLFFKRAEDQGQVRRPAIIHYLSPFEAFILVAVAAGIAGLFFVVLRKIWRAVRRQRNR